MDEEGSLDACVSGAFGVETKDIAVFHQVAYMREKLNAMLDFSITRAIRVFQLPYVKLAILYTFVASPADVAAVPGDMLYAKEVAERLSVEGDFNYSAVREGISKSLSHRRLS